RHTPLPLLPSPPPLFRALLLSNPAPSSHLSPLSLHDALPICDAPAWRARPVIDEHPVGEEAAQRGLELVVVRINEAGHDDGAARSEEHTSELQSLTNLVCRLLLEKKKQTRPTVPTCTTALPSN